MTFFNKLLDNKLATIFFLLVVTIPAIYYLLIPGFYEPHDLHHIADIFQMYRAIVSGQLPPRLGPDFLFSYGYPLFNFYYVLPFYIGASFYSLTGSLTGSYEFVFMLASFLSVWGMYLFLRHFLEKFPSLVGATLFLYTPYRSVQMYVRGAMGEAFALSLLPFVLWIIVKIVKDSTSKNIALGALIISLFILSHNYLWALSIPFIAVLVLLLVDKKQFITQIVSLAISGFLGLGISAYWWLPALTEQSLVASQTPFPLIDHFPFIKQLIIPFWGYGSSVWGPGDEISFNIGIVNLFAVLLAGLLVVFKRKKIQKNSAALLVWGLSGFAISVVFMNSRTYPIWNVMPFHDFVQFPWRLLIYTTLFTAVLAGVVVQFLRQHKQLAVTIGMILLGGSIITTYHYFRPSKIVQKSDQDYLNSMFADQTENGRKETIHADYLLYSEDYLLLPNGIETKPNSLPKKKVEALNGVVANIQEISPVSWKADIDASSDTVLTAHFLYFPGWKVSLDGREVPISQTKEGFISTPVSKGAHVFEINWKETPTRRMGDIISIISLGTIGTVMIAGSRNKRLSKKK